MSSTKLDFVIPPASTHTRWTPMEQASPDGLTSSHRGGSPDGSLWEGVSELDSRVRALATQLKRTDARVSQLDTSHEAHCELLNSLCADLGDYLEMESASSPTLLKSLACALAQRTVVTRVEASRSARGPAEAPVEPPPVVVAPPPPVAVPPVTPAPPTPPSVAPPVPVPDETALAALATARQAKAAVERLEAELSEQRTTFRAQLTALEERLSEQLTATRRQLDVQLQGLQDEMNHRLASLQSADRASVTELSAMLHERIRLIEQTTTQSMESLHRDVSRVEAAIPDGARSQATDILKPVQAECTTLRRRVAELEQKVEVVVGAPRPVIPDLTPQLTQLGARLRSVEATLAESRDEHETATQKSAEREKRYLHLHTEVNRLTAALEVHTEAIHEMQARASLEGPFNEVKDWLLDLEKRAMTRGEMLEVTQRFDAEIADLRLELAKQSKPDSAAESLKK